MDEGRARIVVVENDESVRRLLTRVLIDEGYDVVQATNGDMGFELALERCPDAIVSELWMPILDGIGLVRRLRERHCFDSVPVFLLSSPEDRNMAVRGLEIGATDFVLKPLDTDELTARIRAQLRHRRLHEEVKRDRDETKMLFDMLREGTDSLDVVTMLHRITSRVATVLRAARCSIVLVDRPGMRGRVVAAMDLPGAPSIDLDLLLYPEIVQAVDTRLPVLIDEHSSPELRAALDDVFVNHGVGSILAVPLVFGGEVLGTLMVRTPRGAEPISPKNVRFVRQVAYTVSGLVRLAHQYTSFTQAWNQPPRAGFLEALEAASPAQEIAA